MKLTWIGGPTVLLEIGDIKILTDPMLNGNREAFIMNGHPSTGEDGVMILRNALLPNFDLDSVDYVLVSHMHSDHFDKVAKERIDKKVPIILPQCQRKLLEDKFYNIISANYWEPIKLETKSTKINITPVPARHAHKEDINEDMGVVNGYIIECILKEESYKIYWTGDTVWFEDMKKIKDVAGEVDIFIPNMGAAGVDGPYDMLTLNSEQAIKLCSLMKPKYILPIHHNTFSHYVEPISVFEKEFKKICELGELIILREGECWAK